MPVYECEDCEDIEEWPEWDLEEKGLHCECGGHLFLQKYDNFEEDEEINEKCTLCKNRETDECMTCFFST